MERTDDTGFGGIRVIQTRGSGYGVDAVLLAAFAAGETGARPAAAGSRIADLGTGCGIVAFILHHKLSGAKLTGYDVSPAATDRAKRACALNGLEGDIDFVCADVNELASGSGRSSSGISGIYDAVVSNPPYFRKTPDEPKAAEPDERYIARHEVSADISCFCSAASDMLKEGGSLYLVHRPDRLADIICAMRDAGIEPKELQMVTPRAGAAANIVLIRGAKGAGPELRILPDIPVHSEDGGYTDEIMRLYGRI